MKLYFVRHGESVANRLKEFSNRGRKHPLTETGRQQALQLAQNLRDVHAARIFSSPLLRAVQTSEILSAAFRVDYEITDALREYDCGVLEGRSDSASWEIYDEVLRAWLCHNQWERRIEGGESFLDIKARFVPFIEHLTREYGHSDSDIILVGHGGLYRCMLPVIFVNIDFSFTLANSIPNTSYVVAETRSEGLFCLSWCGNRLTGL
jgi:broad specificity phosphatase PhoE